MNSTQFRKKTATNSPDSGKFMAVSVRLRKTGFRQPSSGRKILPLRLLAGLCGSTAAAGGAAGLGCVKDEGFAVHTLGNGGVLFVSADHDAVKGTEIGGAGVVCALGNGAGDRMIGLLLFHFRIPSLHLFGVPLGILR